ncbi:MAG: class I SAM-dependent methyltransferase [Thermoplasmata archaeon]|nr:class I SAM-dependent methyltransferase [Thermoplasmata archaeon]
MSGLGVARRLSPAPMYQLRHHPGEFAREMWGAYRSPAALGRFFQRTGSEVTQCWRDLLEKDRFYERIQQKEAELQRSGALGSSPGGRADSYSEILYLILRLARPTVVVETGVAMGYSSAYLLQALHDNADGTLYSIDLPTTDPEGRIDGDGVRDRTHVRAPQETGAVVPDDLRDRWKLSLGPSNPLLPELLEKLGSVDVFFHDSDHSYQNMIWEYRVAWPKIRPGGYLLTDDITRNQAFEEFVASVGGRPYRWFGRNGRRGALLRPPTAG